VSVPTPATEQRNDGAVMMVPGQFMRLDGDSWLFVNWSEDDLQEFYSRKLKRHQSFHPTELKAAWEASRLQVLPPTDRPAKDSVLRNIQIPFEHYTDEQQRIMEIRAHYAKKFHEDFPHKVTRGPKSVEAWLEKIEPPPIPHTADERLSKWSVVRAYDDWIAGGRRKEALAHGNANGTHESSLEPVRHIIEDVIEQFLVPFKEMEVPDLLGIILKEIERAQMEGEVPATDENNKPLVFAPCRQTIHNYIEKLSKWETLRIREGVDEADDTHATKGRKPRVEYPFQEWQGDHALLPIETSTSITDMHGNEHTVRMGGVWMTVIVDVATQYVFPLAIGVDAPSTARSMEVIRTAMCPKDEYFKRMGLTGQYDPTVIPEMLFLDNQADNHGRDQDAMMRDLDIENGFAGAYKGSHKESVERFNRVIKKHWRKFPGSLPRADDLVRGKRPRKHQTVPLDIEDIRLESARFVAQYNDTPQKRLGNISPNEAMRRLEAKIKDTRRKGQPLPYRPITEKTMDDIERTFTIRALVTVRDYGVRYQYLEWNCDALKDRIGHRVELRIPPRDVSDIWVFDLDDKVWFQAHASWPFYMVGLPWTEHQFVRARVLKHEASLNEKGTKLSVDFARKYMANKAEGLRRLFELAGKSFELKRGKPRNERLWKRSLPVGHLDFALLSTRAAAVDRREGRIPPGMEKTFKLAEKKGVMLPVATEKPAHVKATAYWETEDDENGVTDLTESPLTRDHGSTFV
jgi:Mu transposase, C-terminal